MLSQLIFINRGHWLLCSRKCWARTPKRDQHANSCYRPKYCPSSWMRRVAPCSKTTRNPDTQLYQLLGSRLRSRGAVCSNSLAQRKYSESSICSVRVTISYLLCKNRKQNIVFIDLVLLYIYYYSLDEYLTSLFLLSSFISGLDALVLFNWGIMFNGKSPVSGKSLIALK